MMRLLPVVIALAVSAILFTAVALAYVIATAP